MWHVHRHKTNITLIKNQLHQYSSWKYDYATAFSKKENHFYRPKTMFLKMFEVDTNEIM